MYVCVFVYLLVKFKVNFYVHLVFVRLFNATTKIQVNIHIREMKNKKKQKYNAN